jgi:hypothetical protein
VLLPPGVNISIATSGFAAGADVPAARSFGATAQASAAMPQPRNARRGALGGPAARTLEKSR